MSDINRKFYLQKFSAEEKAKELWGRNIENTRIKNNYLQELLDKDPTNELAQCMYQFNEIINKACKNSLATMNESCDHDLIMYLGKEQIKEEDIGCAICLSCERTFHLKGKDKDIELDPELILNIEGIIPSQYICSYDGKENILVKRAKKKMLEMSELNIDMYLCEVKENILEDLVYYTDELTNRKTNPRKRIRINKN